MKKVILCSDVELEASAAIALLAASPEVELLGIVAGAGRVCMETAFENACKMVGCLGKKIPVVKGTAGPMVASLNVMRKAWEEPPSWWPAFGLIPEEFSVQPNDILQDVCGVIWMINTLMSSPNKVDILTLGPLTDLALALKIQPEIANHIDRIVLVGGGHRYTDISGAAEFNIWFDPEAAAIVLHSAVSKYLIPLDCAYSAGIRESVIYEAVGTDKFGQMIRCLLHPVYERYEKWFAQKEIPLPMLIGAGFLCASNVLKDVMNYSVDIDFGGGYADGQTIFDTRRIFDDYNCMTTFAADADALLSVIHNCAAAWENRQRT